MQYSWTHQTRSALTGRSAVTAPTALGAMKNLRPLRLAQPDWFNLYRSARPAVLRNKNGEGGIRTPGPVTRTQHFQCCTIGHSATSPRYVSSLFTSNSALSSDKQDTLSPVPCPNEYGSRKTIPRFLPDVLSEWTVARENAGEN